MGTLIRAGENTPNGYLYKRRESRDADGAAHYLTFSCFHRLDLFDNDAIKDRFVEHLCRLPAPVLAWVVMPTHVHLMLVRSDDTSMAETRRAIKTPFAREMINRWKRLEWAGLSRLFDEKSHHFWQEGGGHDRLVVGDELREKIAYTHRNPVKLGLVEGAVDDRWSSATAFGGTGHVGPPVAFNLVPRGARPLI